MKEQEYKPRVRVERWNFEFRKLGNTSDSARSLRRQGRRQRFDASKDSSQPDLYDNQRKHAPQGPQNSCFLGGLFSRQQGHCCYPARRHGHTRAHRGTKWLCQAFRAAVVAVSRLPHDSSIHGIIEKPSWMFLVSRQLNTMKIDGLNRDSSFHLASIDINTRYGCRRRNEISTYMHG